MKSDWGNFYLLLWGVTVNFVPKERSRKIIEKILAKRQRESDDRLAEKRRKYNGNKNKKEKI